MYSTGCGIHNQSAHIKAYYSLTSDLMVTKFHMGILPTLVDKIMHNNFGSASIWPQQKLSSQVSQKYIEPILKCQKEKNVHCIFARGCQFNIIKNLLIEVAGTCIALPDLKKLREKQNST